MLIQFLSCCFFIYKMDVFFVFFFFFAMITLQMKKKKKTVDKLSWRYPLYPFHGLKKHIEKYDILDFLFTCFNG